MSKQIISIGTTANDNTGDPLRTAFTKANANFDELYIAASFPYGGGTMVGNTTATTISVIGTYVPIAGTVAASMLKDFTISASGLLTYTGTTTKHFHIVSNYDINSASNSQITSSRWFKNGVGISAPLERKIGTGTDIGAASLHADAMLSTGDTLQLQVTNLTSATTLTVKNLYLFVMGMPS